MSTIQVDRIIPYQSSSVTIEGGLVQPNAATTGSNTFVGDQIIQGTITASIQEGFALVGGVGNVSTLVATSSFGGALPSGVVSGSAQISSLGFATTGSNTFIGNQIITGSVTISGSAADDLIVFGNTKVSGSSNYVTIGTNNVFAINNSGGGVGVSLDFGGYLAVGTADGSEISIVNDEGQYGSPGNWTGPAIVANNPSNTYPAIIGFQNKSTWTDGRPTFLTPVDISGSVNITDVLQLAGQDPLPGGAVGQLAVSASNLYYHNGSSWTQIN